MVKKGSIVRKTGTKEIYEVLEVNGKILLCKSVNVAALKKIACNIPMQTSEVEIMMDGETDAFDILFGDRDEDT
jgi:hypothetical protein